MFTNFGSMIDQDRIQRIAWEALQKQDKQQTREESRIALIEERERHVDYGSAIFEEYNSEKWEDKLRKDTNIYNRLLTNVEESTMDKIQHIMADFLSCVNSIYEHININPETYCFKTLILDASDAELNLESQRIVDNFLYKHYYRLSKSERDKLYMEQALSLTSEIVLNEDIEVKEAMEHAHKSIIVEKLLQEVNFPKPIYYRIQELMSSEIYGEIFEQEALVDKWNSFKEKSAALSRVFAAVV